jgi:hypothetical protein
MGGTVQSKAAAYFKGYLVTRAGKNTWIVCRDTFAVYERNDLAVICIGPGPDDCQMSQS